LTTAAYLGLHHIVRFLVKLLGADIDISENLGQTPLHAASFNGHLVVVRTLLKLGADINQSCYLGATTLMAASAGKHEEVFKWLIKAGANTQALYGNDPNSTAAFISRDVGASAEQTAYLEAKTHCSNSGCSGAGVMKCTGCKQARYCRETCQLAHWKAHKADCRRWSAELAARKGD
jgi:hypothetical protein